MLGQRSRGKKKDWVKIQYWPTTMMFIYGERLCWNGEFIVIADVNRDRLQMWTNNWIRSEEEERKRGGGQEMERDENWKEKSPKTGTKRSECDLRATESEPSRWIVKKLWNQCLAMLNCPCGHKSTELALNKNKPNRGADVDCMAEPGEQANERARNAAEGTKCFQYHLRWRCVYTTGSRIK